MEENIAVVREARAIAEARVKQLGETVRREQQARTIAERQAELWKQAVQRAYRFPSEHAPRRPVASPEPSEG